jgi:hypothetical protein
MVGGESERMTGGRWNRLGSGKIGKKGPWYTVVVCEIMEGIYS